MRLTQTGKIHRMIRLDQWKFIQTSPDILPRPSVHPSLFFIYNV
nr:MAG TPA: hypothetical protein [Caudoviricetes sp.]